MRRTRQAFDEQLQQLEQRLLDMGKFVRQMLEKAVRALAEQDLELAAEVIREDDIADEMDIEIEQECMRLLALQQPMSRDLRMIGTAMKVIADLERIGDYSVDIARTVRTLAGQPYFKPLEDIPRMCRLTCAMVDNALSAFVERDIELAHRVCAEDTKIDELWRSLRDELMRHMRREPGVVTQATHFLLVARYLERIADHATNVAERVVYMETGVLQQIAASHRST